MFRWNLGRLALGHVGITFMCVCVCVCLDSIVFLFFILFESFCDWIWLNKYVYNFFLKHNLHLVFYCISLFVNQFNTPWIWGIKSIKNKKNQLFISLYDKRNKTWNQVPFEMKFIEQIFWNYRIHRLHLCRGVRRHPQRVFWIWY